MSTTTESIETLSPAEIDEILAELWETESKYESYAASTQAHLDSPRRLSYEKADAEKRLAEYVAKIREAREAAAPYEAEFARRGGWSRFFVVKNVGGHVHSSRSCSTCFPTTSFGWYPKLSGGTEADLVAEFGEMACTVCFPSAPTFAGFGDGTSALARYSADEKAARDAEKAAKRAAKDAKKIFAPDGGPLRVDGYTIETVTAARNELSRKVQDTISYATYYGERGRDDRVVEYEEAIALLEAALAHKGWTPEEIAKVKANAEKKARKDIAESEARYGRSAR